MTIFFQNSYTLFHEFLWYETFKFSKYEIFSLEVLELELGCYPQKVLKNTYRPTHFFSSSLYYLLLTDGGAPECYDEVLEVDKRTKWEHGMDDEMKSLFTNQT